MRKEKILSETETLNLFGDRTVKRVYDSGRETKRTRYPDGVIIKEVDALGNGDWVKEIRWPNGHVQAFRLSCVEELKLAAACPSPSGLSRVRLQPSPEPVSSQLVAATTLLVGQFSDLICDLQDAEHELTGWQKKLVAKINKHKLHADRLTFILAHVELCCEFLIKTKDTFSSAVPEDHLVGVMKEWLLLYNRFLADYSTETSDRRQKNLFKLYPASAQLMERIEDLCDMAAAAARLLSTEQNPLRAQNKLGLFCRQLEIEPPAFISLRDFAR